MESKVNLTEHQWQAAHNFAMSLVENQGEIQSTSKGITTELNRAIAYLRACRSKQKPIQLLNYLTAFVKNGDSVGHGRNNKEYSQCIKEACKQHLEEYLDSKEILEILGWSCRLMRYYQNGGPIGEISPQQSARQMEIEAANRSLSFSLGQVIDAKVTKKTDQRKKVTYEIAGAIKLTENNSKGFGEVTEGQAVKVKVVKLENGKVKKVKYVGDSAE